MGGASGCCVEKDPLFDLKLGLEAQQTGHLSRASNRYNGTERNQENESLINNKEQWNRNHINNKKRGSIVELIDNNKNILLSSETRTRGSDDDELEIESNNNKSKHNNNNNNFDSHSHSHSHHKKTKKKHKHKNKLISALRKCLKEFNKSVKNISLLELMSTENTMNEYNQ
eukprot:357924_1